MSSLATPARALHRGRWVGREEWLLRLSRAFDDDLRLVSLVGPGGIGKSRLASEYLRTRTETAVVYVDLSLASGEQDLFVKVAGALGAQLGGSGAPSETLLPRLATGACLLVLDNAESQVEPLARALTVWLTHAPLLEILVTSREPVRVNGEQVLRIPPLSPQAAYELFCDRASWVCQAERVHSFERASIDQLMEVLEGNPLAISLAAGRSHILSVSELLAGLRDGFDLLCTQQRDMPARHMSLQACVHESWRLLQESEQQALSRLAVLCGGFDLDAADAVLQRPSINCIEGLYQKSLIDIPSSARRTRYRIPPSIRELAEQEASADLWEQAETSHAVFYAGKAQTLLARLSSANAADALDELSLERENLLAVGKRFARRDAALAARAVLPLARMHAFCGPADALLELLEALSVEADNETRAEIEVVVATCCKELRDMPAALAALDRAEALAIEGNRELPGECLCLRAEVWIQSSQLGKAAQLLEPLATLAQAEQTCSAWAAYACALIEHLQGRAHRETYAPAIQLAGRIGDARTEQRAMLSEGVLLYELSSVERARQRLQRAADLGLLLGAPRARGLALHSLGDIEHHLGNYDAARNAWSESLSAFNRASFALGEAFVSHSRARLCHQEGKLDQAAPLYEKTIDLARQRSFATLESLAMADYGLLEWERDQKDSARALLQQAGTGAQASGDERYRAWILSAWALVLDPQDTDKREQLLGEADRGQRAKKSSIPGQIEGVAFLHALARGQEQPRFDYQVQGWQWAIASRLMRSHPIVASPEATLQLGAEGRWFHWRERVDIRRRGAVRRLLLALVEQRLRHPGAGLSVYQLLELGWPDNRVSAESGANRVYWGIATLRGLGLEDCLVTCDEGYMIDPAVTVCLDN